MTGSARSVGNSIPARSAGNGASGAMAVLAAGEAHYRIPIPSYGSQSWLPYWSQIPRKQIFKQSFQPRRSCRRYRHRLPSLSLLHQTLKQLVYHRGLWFRCRSRCSSTRQQPTKRILHLIPGIYCGVVTAATRRSSTPLSGPLTT